MDKVEAKARALTVLLRDNKFAGEAWRDAEHEILHAIEDLDRALNDNSTTEALDTKFDSMYAAGECEASAMADLMTDSRTEMETAGETQEDIESHMDGIAESFLGWAEWWLGRAQSIKLEPSPAVYGREEIEELRRADPAYNEPREEKLLNACRVVLADIKNFRDGTWDGSDEGWDALINVLTEATEAMKED